MTLVRRRLLQKRRTGVPFFVFGMMEGGTHRKSRW